MSKVENEMEVMLFPECRLNIRGKTVTVRPFDLKQLPHLIRRLFIFSGSEDGTVTMEVWDEILKESLHLCCEDLPEQLTAGEGLLILKTVLELDPLLIEGFSTLVEMMTQINVAMSTQTGSA